MKQKEDIIKEYFKKKFPHKVFLKVLVHKEFGGYMRILYTDKESKKEDSVDVSYLDFITWLFNTYISPDHYFIHLN